MEFREKELEDRLKEFGDKLAYPPSGLEELLSLLDQTEIYLSRVEQSPSTSMSAALLPAMNSLVTKEFLNHPEADVKAFVAACINEITRITAPDAPYNDDLMKDVFAIIVDAFGKLDDISGSLYSKRVSILETMARVRSCVVMLDLERDDLILQMFNHFLKSIRPDHPINVFSSMEMIMTLVLEESEDISQELLICLLSNVQKSKKGIMPVAHRLAEKVISKCAVKLKPYILIAVQSMGASLSDYSNIVSYICQENPGAPEKNEVDDSKLCEQAVSDELPQESENLDKAGSCLEEVVPLADKTKGFMSNGVMPLGNGSHVLEPISPELKPEHSCSNEQWRNDITAKGKSEKPGSEQDLKFTEAKSSSIQLMDANDNSRVDGDKEASAPTIKKACCNRETRSLKSNVDQEKDVLFKPETEAQVRPLECWVVDNACINSAGPNDTNNSNTFPKRGQFANFQFRTKKGTLHQSAPAARKKKMSGNTMEKEGSPAVVSDLNKGHEPVSDSDGKPSQDSAKSLGDGDAIDVSEAVINDAKLLKNDRKESVMKAAETVTSGKQEKFSIKQLESKDVIQRDVSTEPCLKEMIALSRSSRAADSHQNHSGKNIKTSSSKKRQRGKEVISEVQHGESELNEGIVGAKIKVWWPDDKKFYKGSIDSFDRTTMKHKVVYDDGDVEVLLLKSELWKYADAKHHKMGQVNDFASPEASLLEPRKKPRAGSAKTKATLDSGGKSNGNSKSKPIQQSGAEVSAVMFRGRHRWDTSKVGISLNEDTHSREIIKVEYYQSNTSVEPPEDTDVVKYNSSSRVNGKSQGKDVLPSDSGKSARSSRGRSRDNTSRIGGRTKALSKDEKTLIESSQTNNSDGDISEAKAVAKDSTSSGGKLAGKSKGRPSLPYVARKTALKSRGRPRGETSKIASTVGEESLNTPGKSEGIKAKLPQTNKANNDTPKVTAVIRGNVSGSGSKSKDDIGTDEKLKEKDTLKLANMSIEGSKSRRIRKRTNAATNDGRAGASALSIKNAEQGWDDSDEKKSDAGRLQRSAMNTNKKRRKQS